MPLWAKLRDLTKWKKYKGFDMQLRFIIRNGEKVLQQCVIFQHYDAECNLTAMGTEWQDVPLVEEEEVCQNI